MKNSTSLERIVDLSNRIVRTEAGSRLYGKPVGSQIIPDTSSKPGAVPTSKITPVSPPKAESKDQKVKSGATPEKEVSLERVKSLQAQAAAAVRTGDESQIKKLTALYHEAVAAYSKERPVSQVIQELKKPLTTKKK